MRIAAMAALLAASPAAAERIWPSLPDEYRSGTVDLFRDYAARSDNSLSGREDHGRSDPSGRSGPMRGVRIDPYGRAIQEGLQAASSGSGNSAGCSGCSNGGRGGGTTTGPGGTRGGGV